MIHMDITGCCEKCEYIDLRLDKLDFGSRIFYNLRCIHQPICGRLIEEDQELTRIVEMEHNE